MLPEVGGSKNELGHWSCLSSGSGAVPPRAIHGIWLDFQTAVMVIKQSFVICRGFTIDFFLDLPQSLEGLPKFYRRLVSEQMELLLKDLMSALRQEKEKKKNTQTLL